MLSRLALCLLALLHLSAGAEEGFWPPESLPPSLSKTRLSASCLRVVDVEGLGSGSLVSAQGLVMTNRHVVAGQLSRLSAQIGLKGYRALEKSAEAPCPDLRIHQLVDQQKVAGGLSDQLRNEWGGPGLRLELRKGLLTRYKVYSDVRLVYAPPGGLWVEDWSGLFARQNMELDVAWLRIYEKGQPLATPEHLHWNERPPQVGEPIMAGGFPGQTSRWLEPVARRFRRDVSLPLRQRKWQHRLHLLNRYARLGEAQELVSRGYRYSASRLSAALQVEQIYWQQQALPAQEPSRGDSLERRGVFGEPGQSLLVQWALLLADQARGGSLYPEADIQQLLGNHQEVSKNLEELLLSDALDYSLRSLGRKDSYVTAALAADSPSQTARRLIGGTNLAARPFRLNLWQHPEQIAASRDPLLRWALKVYRPMLQRQQALTEWWDRQPRRADPPYPDADLSFRLVLGRIKQADLPSTLATDCDATGGLSGSPLVNSQGELVGILARQTDLLGTTAYRPNGTSTGLACSTIAPLLSSQGMTWLVHELREP